MNPVLEDTLTDVAPALASAVVAVAEPAGAAPEQAYNGTCTSGRLTCCPGRNGSPVPGLTPCWPTYTTDAPSLNKVTVEVTPGTGRNTAAGTALTGTCGSDTPAP